MFKFKRNSASANNDVWLQWRDGFFRNREVNKSEQVLNLLGLWGNPVRWNSPNNPCCLIATMCLGLAADSLPNNQHRLWPRMSLMMTIMTLPEMIRSFWNLLFFLLLFYVQDKSRLNYAFMDFKFFCVCTVIFTNATWNHKLFLNNRLICVQWRY